MGDDFVGWRALPSDLEPGFNDRVVYDGLHVGGRCIAVVEAFFDGGPWYANAITIDGEHVRAGAMESQVAAMDWCEERSGVRPIRAHSEPAIGQAGTGEQEGGRG